MTTRKRCSATVLTHSLVSFVAGAILAIAVRAWVLREGFIMNPISETLLWGGIMTIYNLPGLLCATICLSRLNVAAEAVVIPAAVIACIGQVVLMMTAGLTAYGFPMFAFPVSAIVGLGASLIAKRLLSQQHAGGLR